MSEEAESSSADMKRISVTPCRQQQDDNASARAKAVTPPSTVSSHHESTESNTFSFAEIEFLCRFLELSSNQEKKELSDFLVFVGSKTLNHLACIEQQDFNEYRKPLSRTIQRLLLLVAEFVREGGSLQEVGSLKALRQGVKTQQSRSTTNRQDDTNETIIHLNVGGNTFTTTKDTLCRVPGTLLEGMFSGRHDKPTQRTNDGTYVIDRDGTHFQHILNFLRVGAIISLPREADAKEELAIEADYYGLEDLVRAIRMPQVDTSEFLPEDVFRIRREEDALRKEYINGSAHRNSPHRGLVSFFCPDSGVQPLPLRYQFVHSGDEILMGNLRKNYCVSDGVPVTAKSLDDFQSNFNREHPNLLHRLTPILLEEPICIAGGAVLRALTSKDTRTSDWWGKKSDVDLFLYCRDPEEANRIARRVFYALSVDNERWVIVRSAGVITMQNDLDLKVQIVLRLYDSPAEVLLGFDVDCCCCAYDGRYVWVAPRCLRALRTGANILNPLHAWPNKPSYEFRLAKYAYRGFVVVAPGLVRKRIDYDLIRHSNLRQLKGLARLLKISFEMESFPPEMVSNWDVGETPRSANFPEQPLNVTALRNHAREELDMGDFVTRGMFSGYIEQINSVIVPSVYGEPGPNNMIWHDDMARPTARDSRDEAWEEIRNAGPVVPAGLPLLLRNSWQMEKTSREYINAEMDKFDLDNIYYGHAYADSDE